MSAEILLRSVIEFNNMWIESNFDNFDEVSAPIYKFMAEDITRQQKRLGGTFAVAHAVARRKSRDYLRSLMGPDLVFIVMDMTHDCMKERLGGRHSDSLSEDMLTRICLDAQKMFESVGSDEENTYSIPITKGMDKDDVMKAVLDILHQNNLV